VDEKMTENTKHHPITIDINQFKLHIDLKKRVELTLHFNSPSRRFYLSIIAFLVNEMKRQGKITSIPLDGNLDLLVLLNDTVGGSAGSSEKENLLPRIYRKWKDALPNLEEAPLFKVLGRQKKYDEAGGMAYPFTDDEKDNWANLFEYTGSEDKVRLKFAIDKIGARLEDVAIIYEDSVNGEAWDRFIVSLGGKIEKVPETKPIQPVSEVPEPPVSLPKEQGASLLQSRYRWIALIAMVIVIVGAAAWGVWNLYLKPAQLMKATIERMALPLPDKPSIAVLPFVNMSEDKSQEFFSDGMTDDLITDLSKISGLFVIARNSTFVFKGKSVKIQQVAEELGVRYVLEGSVRREGDQVRINAQLVDSMTGRHIWAERYDESIRNIFSLQDKINQKIVAALAVNLTAGEKVLLTQKETDNHAAHEQLMTGREYHRKLTLEDFGRAEACFKRAIELDPEYTHAKAALATLYAAGANYNWHAAFKMSKDEARFRARLYLTEAMKKPTSIAYQVAGWMDSTLRQHDQAVSQLEKALALDPNDPSIHSSMSWVLSMCGRPKEALEHAKMAMRLDPVNPAGYLSRMGLAHYCMGEYQEAVDLTEKAHRVSPGFRIHTPIIVSAYAHIGRGEEAKAAAQASRPGAAFAYGPPRTHMYYYPFKERAVAESFLESHRRLGLIEPGPDFIHVSRQDQLTGDDLKAFFIPSKTTGYGPGGSQWSVETSKDGTVIARLPWIPGGMDTGRRWVEGDKIWTQYQNYNFGLEHCGTVFRNPKGTPEGKDEYVIFNDASMIAFSRAQ
jgi:adenylate cyclase